MPVSKKSSNNPVKGASPHGARKIAVMYHGDCPDGFGAAWAAWKKFGARAAYYPVHHHAPPLPLKGKTIYFLDIIYTGAALKKLQRENVRVTALDHHITTKKEVESTEDHRYALDHSGAVLAWNYFHPKAKVPRALLHIEDVDIWRHALRHTSEVTAAMKLLPFDFKAWDAFIMHFEKAAFRKKTIADGALLRSFEEQLVSRIVGEGAYLVEFAGHKVYAVNAPHLWATEIGHRLYEMKPPFAIVWREKKGMVKVSLRGTGTPDLAKLAERYGGGGHKGAAGFTVLAGKTPWKNVIKEKKILRRAQNDSGARNDIKK